MPWGPWDPVEPCGPCGPWGPVAPGAPGAPVRPWAPVRPRSPRGPRGPRRVCDLRAATVAAGDRSTGVSDAFLMSAPVSEPSLTWAPVMVIAAYDVPPSTAKTAMVDMTFA